MLAQLAKLEANYPGGLAAYIQSARNLLGQSVRGENPLQGWSPSVPKDGFDLAPGSYEFGRHEERGLAEAAHKTNAWVFTCGERSNLGAFGHALQ